MSTLLRSLGSTTAIAGVVFVVTELRAQRFVLTDLRSLILGYWKFFLALFFALAIWDYWFWRVQQGRRLTDDERNE